MNEIMVGELSEFAEGDYRVLRVDAFEFGIFRQGDRLVAYENHCPHDGGPVCQGKVIPRVEEELAPDQTSRGLRFSKKQNIVCPWHGWEFDIEIRPPLRRSQISPASGRREVRDNRVVRQSLPPPRGVSRRRRFSQIPMRVAPEPRARMNAPAAGAQHRALRQRAHAAAARRPRAPQGIRLVPTMVHPSEMFWRQLRFAEFDVSEMSMSSLIISVSRGDTRWVAIPVFTMRKFFHTSIIVRTDSGIAAPADLRGKRIGVPEYQQTWAIWARGVLQHEFGVHAARDRVVHGAQPRQEPRRRDRLRGARRRARQPDPADHQYRRDAAARRARRRAALSAPSKNLVDRSTVDVSGVDPALCFPIRPPRAAATSPRPGCSRSTTRVVVRRSLLESHPWIALNLYSAFVAAKEEIARSGSSYPALVFRGRACSMTASSARSPPMIRWPTASRRRGRCSRPSRNTCTSRGSARAASGSTRSSPRARSTSEARSTGRGREARTMSNGYDYIIVGARLGRLRAGQPAERGPRRRVLLLEAGGRDLNPLIHIPLGLGKMHEYGMFDWGYHTEPEPEPQQPPHRGDARQGAGRLVLDQRDGLYARRSPATTTAGRRRARAAGPMRTCCPTSSACETWEDGESEWRGGERPARHRSGPRRSDPLFDAWIEAAQGGGLPVHRRLQRQAAGRLRPQPIHHPRRHAARRPPRPICKPALQAAKSRRSRPARMRRAS